MQNFRASQLLVSKYVKKMLIYYIVHTDCLVPLVYIEQNAEYKAGHETDVALTVLRAQMQAC